MTNVNKINMRQKSIMAEYMCEHANLARNIIPHCSQGRATTNRLWDALATKLNGAGPPIKDAKAWRKVFADQKHNAKMKLSFNKKSKKRTGGGPYEERPLTAIDEQIIQAAGIDVSVEGMTSVKRFGNSAPTELTKDLLSSDEESDSKMEELSTTVKEPENGEVGETNKELPTTSIKNATVPRNDEQRATNEIRTKRKEKLVEKSEKLSLIKTYFKTFEESQSNIIHRLDKLIALKERSVALKEEETKRNALLSELDLKIKRIKLERLETLSSKSSNNHTVQQI